MQLLSIREQDPGVVSLLRFEQPLHIVAVAGTIPPQVKRVTDALFIGLAAATAIFLIRGFFNSFTHH